QLYWREGHKKVPDYSGLHPDEQALREVLMAFAVPKINYTGAIREVTLGTGSSAVTVGGESCYPFYVFEGAMPRVPRIAFEVWDYAPEDWPDWAVEPYRDVI